ncbi:hypothetical protein Tco_0438854, partial [Tanacetum coccineum]
MCKPNSLWFILPVKESLMGDLKARSVSYAKLLGHALVFTSQKGQGILVNSRGIIFPMQMYPGSFSRSLFRVQVSTMAVKDDLIVAGGFYGELICKWNLLQYKCLNVCFKIGSDNAILDDQFLPCSGAMRVMTANYDAHHNVIDARVLLALITSRSPGYALYPDGKLISQILGDSTIMLDCRCSIKSTLNTTRMSATMMKPQIFEATPNKAVFQKKMYRGCGAICCANSMSSGAGVAG